MILALGTPQRGQMIPAGRLAMQTFPSNRNTSAAGRPFQATGDTLKK
jgi:hypothetical protein